MKIKISFLILFILAPFAQGAEHLFYKEVNLIGGYTNEDDWVGKTHTLKNSVGFEDLRKFSNEYGDYLTTNLQARLAFDPDPHEGDTWTIEIHNAWADYKLSPQYKLRAGHFDQAFGLEPEVDTHSTILQTLAMDNLGFKKDWGASLHGFSSYFDYAASLTLGSGMTVERKDGSHLAAARISNPSRGNTQVGGSLMFGKVLKAMSMQTFPRPTFHSQDAMEVKRLGLDVQHLWQAIQLRGEFMYGEDSTTPVLGYLGEAHYNMPHKPDWTYEFQYKSWFNNLNKSRSDDSTLSLGLSRQMTAELKLRTMVQYDTHIYQGDEDVKFYVQAYYYAK